MTSRTTIIAFLIIMLLGCADDQAEVKSAGYTEKSGGIFFSKESTTFYYFSAPHLELFANGFQNAICLYSARISSDSVLKNDRLKIFLESRRVNTTPIDINRLGKVVDRYRSQKFGAPDRPILAYNRLLEDYNDSLMDYFDLLKHGKMGSRQIYNESPHRPGRNQFGSAQLSLSFPTLINLLRKSEIQADYVNEEGGSKPTCPYQHPLSVYYR